jgi:hypothetical protein
MDTPPPVDTSHQTKQTKDDFELFSAMVNDVLGNELAAVPDTKAATREELRMIPGPDDSSLDAVLGNELPPKKSLAVPTTETTMKPQELGGPRTREASTIDTMGRYKSENEPWDEDEDESGDEGDEDEPGDEGWQTVDYRRNKGKTLPEIMREKFDEILDLVEREGMQALRPENKRTNRGGFGRGRGRGGGIWPWKRRWQRWRQRWWVGHGLWDCWD